MPTVTQQASNGGAGLGIQGCLTPQAELGPHCCAGSRKPAGAADVLARVCVCRSGGWGRSNGYCGLFFKSPVLTCILPCIAAFGRKHMGTHHLLLARDNKYGFTRHTHCSATHKHSPRWKTHPELCPDSSRRLLGSWWRVGAPSSGMVVRQCGGMGYAHGSPVCARHVCVGGCMNACSEIGCLCLEMLMGVCL